jgi:hypothetical protein
MSTETAPLIVAGGVRTSASFRMDVAPDIVADLVSEIARTSTRFDLLESGPLTTVLLARANARSFGERVTVTSAAAGNHATDVHIGVAPAIKTTLVDWDQGRLDVVAVAQRLRELAAGPPLLPLEARPMKPRHWETFAVVGFVMTVAGVIVAALPGEYRVRFLEGFYGLPLALGFVTSLATARTPRVGLRGRNLAITGVVIGGVFLLGLLVWAAIGIVEYAWL